MNGPFDLIIVGSGLSGLTAALRSAPLKTLVITKTADILGGSSPRALGGIAVPRGRRDIPKHIEDSFTAGGGAGNLRALHELVEGAAETLEWLQGLGVHWDTDAQGHVHWGREAGHQSHRTLHLGGDATGLGLVQHLRAALAQASHVSVETQCLAEKILRSENRVTGLRVRLADGRLQDLESPRVLLASGGWGALFFGSTSPEENTGDALALALEAGVAPRDTDLMQFHPTGLDADFLSQMEGAVSLESGPSANPFAPGWVPLLTEALRGAGATLVDDEGREIPIPHPLGPLAPRDVVARAVFDTRRRGSRVWLDTAKLGSNWHQDFPSAAGLARQLGWETPGLRIPVAPAAHYSIGGIPADSQGRTALPGLYALGECASTGIHGANRLAGNSLLECLVYGRAAAEDITRREADIPAVPDVPEWDESQVRDSDEDVVISHNWDELRHFMWDYVGIVRSNKRLERAMRRINLLKQEIDEYYSHFKVSNNMLELRNLVCIAKLIVSCAMQRKESRGLHYNLDYPNLLENSGPSIIKKPMN